MARERNDVSDINGLPNAERSSVHRTPYRAQENKAERVLPRRSSPSVNVTVRAVWKSLAYATRPRDIVCLCEAIMYISPYKN